MKPRIPPVVVVIGAAALMWAVREVLPGAAVRFPGRALLAAALAAAGVGVTLLGIVSFGRARTTVDPLAPERASRLVVSGIYRVSRNPMYLGFALLLAAWGVWLASPPALLVVPAFAAFLTRYQIRAEERALEARFGEDFLRYKRSVRRWL